MKARQYKTPQPDNSHYVSLQEATRLGYGAYQTLRGYINEGRLPAVKVGARVKILRTDLDGLVQPYAPPRETPTNIATRIADAAGPLNEDEIAEIAAIITRAEERGAAA